MPTYTIEGKRIKTDAPLSDADIDEIASNLRGKAPAVAAATETPAETPSLMSQVGDVAATLSPVGFLPTPATLRTKRDMLAGAIRGAGSIGATLMRPFESAEENAARRAAMTSGLQEMGAQPNTLAFQTGKLGGEIAGTAGVGNVLALPFRAAAPVVAAALESGGTAANLPLWLRGAGGAATGAASGALIEPTPENAVAGGLFGGMIPMGVQAVRRGLDTLSPIVRAQNILRQGAGDTAASQANNMAAIMAANRNAPAGVSASQAAADAAFAPGYQNILRSVEETAAERGDITAKKRALEPILDRLKRVAGGATATEAKTTAAGTKEALSNLTGPMREDALSAVQRRAEIVQEAKQTGRQLMLAPEHPGATLETPKPLDVSELIRKVEGMADSSAVRVDNVQSGVLKNVAALIRDEVKRGDGVMDARALYGIRKSAINTEVQRLMPNADAKAQKKRAAELLSDLKPYIDKALTEAGGTGWAQYLKTFEQGMNAANQQAMAAKLLATYKSSPDTFLKIMAGEDPKAVEKIFGAGNFDLAEEMGSKLAPARELESFLRREANIAEQVSAGGKAAQRILEGSKVSGRIPNLLSPKVAVANAGIAQLEHRVNKKVYEKLLAAAQSGASMNELLNMAPPSQQTYLLNAFEAAARRAGPATINAMSEDR